MITTQQKHEIGRLLNLELNNLGSWTRVANKVKVNQNTVRYNMTDPDKWFNVSDRMWADVAAKLGYKLGETPWQLVPTTNTQVMFELLNKAQNEQLFTAISHEAGQGKTAGVSMYMQEKDAVFYVECEESWSHKRFVQRIAETLGLRVESYNVSDLTDMIVNALKQKAALTRPLLIIDEANKLKPMSLRFFIPLYNKLHDDIGCVIIGAHDLRRHMESGVRRDARGFDELESRFGRAYMPLYGILEADVAAICTANGLKDKELHRKIWERMQPEKTQIGGRYVWISKQDLRVLQQAVKHERAAMIAKATSKEITVLETAMGGLEEWAAA